MREKQTQKKNNFNRIRVIQDRRKSGGKSKDDTYV